MLGEQVGNFRVTALLGRGGMGEVYAAEQTSVGTRVAIKALSSELSADAEYVQRLFNEARAVSRIRHPGAVQIFDVGVTAQGRAYLIMELLDGDSLRRALVRGRFDAARIAELGTQLAEVLEATHAAGITHRDLKPDNIFLVADAQVAGGTRIKVLDFGIAKLTGTLHAHSPRTTGTMGTPAYMAPEQWGDPTRIDQRADLYALGCVLFEMATGRVPFLVSTMAEACGKHVNEAPPRARAIAADVPHALDDLCDRLLAKDPAARPTTRDVIAALASIATGSAPTAASQRTVATSLPPPRQADAPSAARDDKRRTNKWLWLGLVAVVGMVAVVAILAAGSSKGASPRSPSPAAATPGATPPLDAAGATTSLPSPTMAPDVLAVIERDNPWFDYNGVPAQMLTVRRHEYLRWVASLPPERQAWATPLFRSAIDGDDAAINWITYEQAEAYCIALGAKLPDEAHWQRMVGPDGNGITISGIRLWTSTKENGKAVVRGAFGEMQPAAIDAEKPWRFLHDTEASAGGRSERDRVASKEIGVRCIR